MAIEQTTKVKKAKAVTKKKATNKKSKSKKSGAVKFDKAKILQELDELINKNPSTVTDAYWIYISRDNNDYPRPTANCGKWLIFGNFASIDEVWQKIRKATKDGLLGSGSKVSTARPNPNSSNPNKFVICVYTYDATDDADRTRIREELRALGIVSKIPYKTDRATIEGKYEVKGNTKISSYYE